MSACNLNELNNNNNTRSRIEIGNEYFVTSKKQSILSQIQYMIAIKS